MNSEGIKMKFLIINGSPRRQNTWKIIERTKDTLTNLDENITFTEIDLINENIPCCIGCYNCFTKGEYTCPHSSRSEEHTSELQSRI